MPQMPKGIKNLTAHITIIQTEPMKKLWIAHSEISVEPGDLPSGSTLMFCNVITWAEEPEEAEKKIRAYLSTFNWILIDADKIELVDNNKDYGDEFNELLLQAAGNPNAIILSRFYSYRTS